MDVKEDKGTVDGPVELTDAIKRKPGVLVTEDREGNLQASKVTEKEGRTVVQPTENIR